jgi:hypothetical protein
VKKIILMMVVSFLALALCGVSFAQEAKMIEINGKVYILEKGQTEWTKAFKGKVINEGDKVKTKGGSSAFISFDEEKENVIKVEPKTEIELEQTEPTVIEMPKGTIMSKIDDLDKGSTFQIRTPTAIAGVSGTGWRTIYNPWKKKFEAHVHEGAVTVYTSQKSAENTRGLAYAAVPGGYQGHSVNSGFKGIFDNGIFSEKMLSKRDIKRWCDFLSELEKLSFPVILCEEDEEEEKVRKRIEKGQEKGSDRLFERKGIESKIEEGPVYRGTSGRT